MKLQFVERAWRALWMRAITRLLPARGDTTPPDWSSRQHRVLFLRYERIGDMIMATGVIRVLAQSHPNIELDVLATATTRPVLENNPHVRQVFTLDRKSFIGYLRVMRQLRRQKYDVIVDGRLNNPPIFTSTPLLMLAARARYRIGSGGGRNDRVYNIALPAYDRNAPYVEGSKELARPFRVDPSTVDWQPEIFLTDQERKAANYLWETALSSQQPAPHAGQVIRKRLLVNLSASEPKRRWPDGKFVAVLRAARARHGALAVIVIGLPSEWPSVQEVALTTGSLAVATPDLRDALALVGTSDLVLTPDTSISHAASAFRRPSVVLLKREHRPYAPYNTPGEIVLWNEKEIQQMPHERVSAAVERLLDQYGHG